MGAGCRPTQPVRPMLASNNTVGTRSKFFITVITPQFRPLATLSAAVASCPCRVGQHVVDAQLGTGQNAAGWKGRYLP